MNSEVTTGRHVPCLRKDFMVHPLQIIEAAEAGARAILIIVRALEDEDHQVRLYESRANSPGSLLCLKSTRKRELERALRHGAQLIGVNNRNLATFKTDPAFSEQIIPQIRLDCLCRQ